MDREILLGITGMQWEMMDDGEQKTEDAEAVEMLTSADYFFKNGKHYFVYDETSGSGRIWKKQDQNYGGAGSLKS